ncbi:hypothetical protein AB1Y20_012924 [Prymnesium parvum]|uniref:Protein S-acyltransferase n=1 Tax=Prymnesium parvum TaxID=97485 RepID=A0AB34ILP8_PRYPA
MLPPPSEPSECQSLLTPPPPPSGWHAVASLPPLPLPDRRARASQAALGALLVASLAASLAAATAAAAPPPRAAAWLSLVAAEAAAALGCLLGLLLADPGALRRSPERCFPLPPRVEAAVRRGAPLRSNVEEGGRTFCVRCLVWREEGEAAHHCATCGVCVRDFGHHCAVFGRCIAGKGFRGTRGYFKGIIAAGAAGVATPFTLLLVEGLLQEEVCEWCELAFRRGRRRRAAGGCEPPSQCLIFMIVSILVCLNLCCPFRKCLRLVFDACVR